MDETPVNSPATPFRGNTQPDIVRLILIPLIIVIVWLLENYLLAGNTTLFEKANLTGLVLYTILSAVVVGVLIPVVRIRAAFLSGMVNMFQIGFRSLRRTVSVVSLTAVAAYIVVIFLNFSGGEPARETGAMLFIAMLPTAIAAVMICWLLVGTHVQAYVRSGGILISVITGVVITALVFALSMSALFAGAHLREMFAGFFGLGCIAALFFFAVRDIYGTVIVVAAGLCVLLSSRIDPVYLVPFNPVVALCGLFASAVLVGVHAYFSRHYTTVVLPGK